MQVTQLDLRSQRARASEARAAVARRRGETPTSQGAPRGALRRPRGQKAKTGQQLSPEPHGKPQGLVSAVAAPSLADGKQGSPTQSQAAWGRPSTEQEETERTPERRCPSEIRVHLEGLLLRTTRMLDREVAAHSACPGHIQTATNLYRLRIASGPVGMAVEFNADGHVIVGALKDDPQTRAALAAKASGVVRLGDELLAVNGQPLATCMSLQEVACVFREASRPLMLLLRRVPAPQVDI